MLGVPALFRQPPPSRPGPGRLTGLSAFDPGPREALSAAPPDYVILGNSMAYTNIDPALLGRLTGDRRVAMLAWPSSSTEHWYLALKNYVAAARVKPRAVVVLFRDTELSQPLGMRQDLLPQLSLEHEPALAQLETRDCRTERERVVATVEQGLTGAWPLSLWASAEWGRTATDFLAPRAVWGEREIFEFHADLNALFDLGHVRANAARPPEVEEVRTFARRMDCSLLPEMVEVARTAGVRLVLVRVQRKPTPMGPPSQPRELVQYLAELRDWAEARGVPLIDLTGDPRLTLEMYRGDDHIAPEFMPRYTQVLFDRLREHW
jgi:hypothetical protein